MPEADLFIGVDEYEKLPELLSELDTRKVDVSGCPGAVLKSQPRKLPEHLYSATIKIAEGCNNICAYCIIPKIRGKYRSKREEGYSSRGAGTCGCRPQRADSDCAGCDLLRKKICTVNTALRNC